MLAHRFAWLLTYGTQPSGLLCHICDNRKCVRPEHLFEGSPGDNTQDARSKGRLASGESHGRRKLTKRQVARIRESAEPTKSLSRRFGVSERHIRDLRAGKYWQPPPGGRKPGEAPRFPVFLGWRED